MFTLMFVASLSAFGAQSTASAPCAPNGRELRLVPRDEGPEQATFVEFRRQLQEIVRRRDETALRSHLDPAIKVGFDGSDGIAQFLEQHVRSRDEDFWTEFDRILSWGGRFMSPTSFVAPYVFADWPDSADSFECLAVVGSRVKLRERPSLDAPTNTLLTHVIVQRLDDVRTMRAWQRIRMTSGQSGYVSTRYLRSPVDHRAFFELRDGRWRMVTYIAGD